VFDPLDHFGLPVDHHGRHWHELDVQPVDTRARDPYAASRISTMAALETAAAQFDRRLTPRVRDSDARRSVGRLGESASQRRQHVVALSPRAETVLENAIHAEQAAFDLVTWVARNAVQPDRALAYERQARRHLQRLRSYAELGDRAGLRWASRLAGKVDELWPTWATARATVRGDGRRPASAPSVPAQQPMSVLHDWTVRAADQQVARSSRGIVQRAPESETGRGGWEQLVVHESATCYLYYSFLAEETDRQLRPVWELHLQMELAHLRAAGDLLRRHAGRDPREVLGAGLPEPIAMEGNGRYLASLVGDDTESAADAAVDRQDVLDALTEQHARIEEQFQRVFQARSDARRAAFGELAQMLAVHEIVEEEVVHPVSLRLDPDGHLVDHLLDEERSISEALGDAVRADPAGGSDETINPLHDMVRAHARHEERAEFPRLRAAVPADERRQMTQAVLTAEDAADEPAEPQTLHETAERVRDALRSTA
jgi:hypothetical protein